MNESSKTKMWFCELQANGKAPDWKLVLEFEKGSALNDWMRGFPLAHYVFKGADVGLDVYLCKDHLDQHQAIQAGQRKQLSAPVNIFSVDDAHITITRYQGGHSLRDYAEEEMKLLLALLQGGFNLKGWVLSQGGNDHFTEFKTGKTQQSLLQYLAGLP